jgi:hypothetical protein
VGDTTLSTGSGLVIDLDPANDVAFDGRLGGLIVLGARPLRRAMA